MNCPQKIVPRFSLDQWYHPQSTLPVEKQIVSKILSDLEPEKQSSFLSPSLSDIPDPFLLKGMTESVEKILDVMDRKEKILIIGDYDVDGITSSSLLLRFFQIMQYTNCTCFIPNRFRDGYGLTPKVLEEVCRVKPDLVITVDNGITSREAVDLLDGEGIDVIVTDHHMPMEGMFPNCLVVNPKQEGCNYPHDNIAGVGVVFLLLVALRKALRDRHFWKGKEPNLLEHLDLVALGTIADQVPLIGLNRIFAHFGLEQMTKKIQEHSPGTFSHYLAILEKKAKIKFFSSDSISFQIAPLLNAAGRMNDAINGVNFLLSDSEIQALKNYRILERLNQQRRKKQVSMTKNAMLKAEPLAKKYQGLLVYDESYHEGLIGIIASRLSDNFSLPSIVVTDGEDGMLKGSCRARNVNILEILKKCDDTLEYYGGHANAAGCSFRKENLENFHEQFVEACELEAPGDKLKTFKADIEVDLRMLSHSLVDELKKFEPFGQQNQKPIFVIKNQPLPDTMPINKKHLKWNLGMDMEMIYWNGIDQVPMGERFDIAFTLGLNTFRGNCKRQLTVQAVCLNSDE